MKRYRVSKLTFREPVVVQTGEQSLSPIALELLGGTEFSPVVQAGDIRYLSGTGLVPTEVLAVRQG